MQMAYKRNGARHGDPIGTSRIEKGVQGNLLRVGFLQRTVMSCFQDPVAFFWGMACVWRVPPSNPGLLRGASWAFGEL